MRIMTARKKQKTLDKSAGCTEVLSGKDISATVRAELKVAGEKLWFELWLELNGGTPNEGEAH